MGALAAGAWSLTLPDRYTSSAVLHLGENEPQEALIRLQKLQKIALGRRSLAAIIVGQHLYERERARQPLEDIIQNMRNRDLRIVYLKDSQFFVSFANDDPATAQAAVRAVVTALVEANVQVDLRHTVNMEVMRPASLPGAPSGPNRTEMVGRGLLAGLVCGILCGALWSIIRGRKQWSLKRVGAFAVGGAAIGITIALLVPYEYISTAVLRTNDSDKLALVERTAFSKDALAALIQKNRLYPGERFDQAVEKMRKTAIRVQVAQVKGGDGTDLAFIVSFRYPDRYKAQQVTRDLVAQITGAMPAEVLDPPSDPQSPSSPNRPQIVAFAIFAGILLGLAASRFRRPPVIAAA